MKNVTIREISVNGEKRTTWNYRGNLQGALRDLYENQGVLYYEEFGVSETDAKIAGWHPEDNEFTTNCEGWAKFFKDRGIVRKTEDINTISVFTLIEELFQEEEKDEEK